MTNDFDNIRKWALERNLVYGSDMKSQMLKLAEEHGELAMAIRKNDFWEIKDAIGDMVVVLTILAMQNAIDIEECIHGAYNEIANRKGKMVNGIFVKEP